MGSAARMWLPLPPAIVRSEARIKQVACLVESLRTAVLSSTPDEIRLSSVTGMLRIQCLQFQVDSILPELHAQPANRFVGVERVSNGRQ